MPELSIIVPVYNVEKYLSKCIDSILAQTFKDFELILVDDGSPDNCGKIIDEYAEKDSRIVIIHQKNAGVSAARNAGLKKASGTYVGFVDPDDTIEPEMYNMMIEGIKNHSVEIVCCAFDRISENDETIRNNNADFSGELSRFEFLRHLFDAPRTILGGNCNKLFYREMTSKYDEQLTMCEDYVFLLDYSKNMSKAFFINKPFYHYRERAGSVDSYTSNYTIAVDARLSLISLIANIDLELRKYAENDYLDCLCWMKKDCKRVNDTKTLKSINKRFRCYYKENFMQVIRNNVIHWKQKFLYCISYILRV